MTLIDANWIKEHKFDEVYGKTGTECVRCGQCCLNIPCIWSQMVNVLLKGESCPDLTKNDDGTYTCELMSKNTQMKREMIGTGCHYPEWRKG